MLPLVFSRKELLSNDNYLLDEWLLTNREGVCASSTLCGCNTRRYHSLLSMPVGGVMHNLLSGFDEVLCTPSGASFRLSCHAYRHHGGVGSSPLNVNHRSLEGITLFPHGVNYLSSVSVERSICFEYVVGDVVLRKELLLCRDMPALLVRYSLSRKGSVVGSPGVSDLPDALYKLNISPLLSPRPSGELNTSESVNSAGVIHFELSVKSVYSRGCVCLKNVLYTKDRERGYPCEEDVFQEGTYSVPLRVGESVVIYAGINTAPNDLNDLWQSEYRRRSARLSLFDCVREAASQCYCRIGNRYFLRAGFPWYGFDARCALFSLADCTLGIGRDDYFYPIMNNLSETVSVFADRLLSGAGYAAMSLGGLSASAAASSPADDILWEGCDVPDLLLWYMRCVQELSGYATTAVAAREYGDVYFKVLGVILDNRLPGVYVHDNGLLYVVRRKQDKESSYSIAGGGISGGLGYKRYGYAVDTNALWYNDLCFSEEIYEEMEQKDAYTACVNRAKSVSSNILKSFTDIFFNGHYLSDFVADGVANNEVRPFQLWAVGLPYSPITPKIQRLVVDICTRELLTPKGLRSLSPRSGLYRPVYVSAEDKTGTPNYSDGPLYLSAWASYARAYLHVYGKQRKEHLRRCAAYLESDLRSLCIGTFNELYDGNPPYAGHGGMSYVCSLSGVICLLKAIE